MKKTALHGWVGALVFLNGMTAYGGATGTVTAIDVQAMAQYPVYENVEPAAGRDPFTASDQIFRAAGEMPAGQASQGFVPYFSAARLPKMRVRGFVNNGPGQSMALLQIEGEDVVHLVQKGDEIGIQTSPASGNTVLKIINVDMKKVEVQSGSLRQVIIVQ